jgi:hypothetical protein
MSCNVCAFYICIFSIKLYLFQAICSTITLSSQVAATCLKTLPFDKTARHHKLAP